MMGGDIDSKHRASRVDNTRPMRGPDNRRIGWECSVWVSALGDIGYSAWDEDQAIGDRPGGERLWMRMTLWRELVLAEVVKRSQQTGSVSWPDRNSQSGQSLRVVRADSRFIPATNWSLKVIDAAGDIASFRPSSVLADTYKDWGFVLILRR